MITQLDNTLTPLIERCKNALGHAPIVSIDYLDKDHVQVRIYEGDIQVTAHYNSFLEGIKNQFDEFISEVQEIMRRENSQHRNINDIFNELDEIFEETQRPPQRVGFNSRVTIDEPDRTINWRELEW